MPYLSSSHVLGFDQFGKMETYTNLLSFSGDCVTVTDSITISLLGKIISYFLFIYLFIFLCWDFHGKPPTVRSSFEKMHIVGIE